jgi:hypothetical protein
VVDGTVDTLTLDAFQGLFIPYRLHMVLAGRQAEWITDDVSPSAEVTYLHETVHWWQTAMTGYGHSTWSLHRRATSFIIGEWVQATAGTPHVRPIPVERLLLSPENPRLTPAPARFEVARITAVGTL